MSAMSSAVEQRTATQRAGNGRNGGTATERFIRDSRRMVGLEATDVPPGTRLADWVAIERFLNATGDENPLYRDPNYGAASAHRTMLAPPAFVLAVRTPTSSAALYQGDYEGLLPLLTAAELEWTDQIRLGDRIDADLRIGAVRQGPEWQGRATAQVESAVDYRKLGAGQPFARARGTTTLYPIKRGGDERFVSREIHSYSDEEVRQIEQELDAEPPRTGGRPRWARDVQPGDTLPTLVKGPLTLSDLMTWAVAEAKPIKLGGLVYREVVTSPGRARTNPSTNWPYWDAEHEAEDLQSCRDAGFPGPYGRGAMRVALAGQLLTHWMGDDGFLRRLSVQLPAPFIYGDVMRLGGTVRDRYTQHIGRNAHEAVDIELSGVNQLGETVLSGEAVVYLPQPGKPVVLPIEQ